MFVVVALFALYTLKSAQGYKLFSPIQLSTVQLFFILIRKKKSPTPSHNQVQNQNHNLNQGPNQLYNRKILLLR